MLNMYEVPQTYDLAGYTFDLYHVCYNSDNMVYFDYQYYGNDLPNTLQKYQRSTRRLVNFKWVEVTGGNSSSAPSCSQSNLLYWRGSGESFTHYIPSSAQPYFIFGVFILLAVLCVGLFRIFKR